MTRRQLPPTEAQLSETHDQIWDDRYTDTQMLGEWFSEFMADGIWAGVEALAEHGRPDEHILADQFLRVVGAIMQHGSDVAQTASDILRPHYEKWVNEKLQDKEWLVSEAEARIEQDQARFVEVVR